MTYREWKKLTIVITEIHKYMHEVSKIRKSSGTSYIYGYLLWAAGQRMNQNIKRRREKANGEPIIPNSETIPYVVKVAGKTLSEVNEAFLNSTGEQHQ